MRRTVWGTLLAFLSPALGWAGEDLAPVSARFAAAEAKEVPSFQRHVVPLLGRLGCNGRACHGSFQGQGGFRLSLFGYDFKADNQVLLDDDSPRVDVKSPAESLILAKPVDAENHDGGKRFDKEGWEYRVLLRWIEGGAKFDPASIERLARLEITPAEIAFQAAGQ